MENILSKKLQQALPSCLLTIGSKHRGGSRSTGSILGSLQKPNEFINSKSHIGWLKKTVENKALHILREQKYSAALFMSIEELSPSQEPVALEDNSFELTDLFQEVVSREELGFFFRIAKHESTFWEESEMQGIRLTTCYKRFERIREKLQQALEDYHKHSLSYW